MAALDAATPEASHREDAIYAGLRLKAAGVDRALASRPDGIPEPRWRQLVESDARWSRDLVAWVLAMQWLGDDPDAHAEYAGALISGTFDGDFAERLDRERKARRELTTAMRLGHRLSDDEHRFLTSTAGNSATTCDAIAAYARDGRTQELEAAGRSVEGTNHHRYAVLLDYGGTMRVPSAAVYDLTDFAWSAAGATADDGAPTADRYWYPSMRTVVGPTGPYVVLDQGSSYPIAAYPLDDGPPCRFAVRQIETMTPATSKDEETCSAIVANRTRGVRLDRSVPEKGDRSGWAESHPDAAGDVVIANDGVRVRIVRLGLSSGAGAGCDATWFDTLDPASPRREALLSLQAEDHARQRHPAPCFNAPRFHRYRGMTYFEQAPTTPGDPGQASEYRDVSRLRGDTVVPVCRFRYRTEVRVVDDASLTADPAPEPPDASH